MTSPTEAENHMRILRAWGTATPVWAAETIERLSDELERAKHALRNLVNAVGPTPTISVDRADELAREFLLEDTPHD